MYNKLSLMIFVFASVNHVSAMEGAGDQSGKAKNIERALHEFLQNKPEQHETAFAAAEKYTQRGVYISWSNVIEGQSNDRLNSKNDNQSVDNTLPNVSVNQKKDEVNESSSRCAYPSF